MTESVNDGFLNLMQKYTENEYSRRVVDAIQSDVSYNSVVVVRDARLVCLPQLKCCGATKPEDWANAPFNALNGIVGRVVLYNVPESCCANQQNDVCDAARKLRVAAKIPKSLFQEIISDMWIEELSYSDHLPIVLQINTGYEAIKSSYKNEILTRKFIWTKENVEMLKHNLSDIEVGNETDINIETVNFTKQIYTAMESANIIKFAKRRHQLSKPWYDKDCYILKKTTKVSLQRCRNSNNIHDRQKYIEARREYFKLLQRKRDEFNKDKNEKIKNAKDPKSFWNAIASFRKNQ
ncbi:hypothetical protein LAZ67_11001058 [Cordylochernes scorpioides]|uniref:Endonuclease/exonuclease/phosphatase domain-containing protein n=1 Tax=Cordylochernes scorpioides TaxID=51811 RepID=A0ABY6L222_9ARAC|nr:hypothetical protein LAZ67_11001058 [Cordylochernes scorpioides]